MPYGYNSTSGSSVGTAAGYQADCLSCTAGFYCLNATVTPFKCGKGYYTKAGQSVCQVSFLNILVAKYSFFCWIRSMSLRPNLLFPSTAFQNYERDYFLVVFFKRGLLCRFHVTSSLIKMSTYNRVDF